MAFSKLTKKTLELFCYNDLIFSSHLKQISPHKSLAYKKVKELEERGWVKKMTINSRSKFWCLTDAGKSAVSSVFPEYESSFSIDDIDDTKLVHSEKTANILFSLMATESNLQHIKSERMCHQFFANNKLIFQQNFPGLTARVPDLLMDIEGLGKTAFEIELVQKSKSRYRKIWSFYLEFSNIQKIVWVVENKKIQTTLQNLFSSFHNDFISLQNIDIAKEKIHRAKHLHQIVYYKDMIANGFSKAKKIDML